MPPAIIFRNRRALPPCDGTHEPFPFLKASLEAECAGFVVARPRRNLTALAALRVMSVSVMPARDEDVRGERVVVGFHCGDFIFDFGESPQSASEVRCEAGLVACGSCEHNALGTSIYSTASSFSFMTRFCV